MLLGKRPRASIKRTTSMTGITVAVDPSQENASQPSDHDHQLAPTNCNHTYGDGVGYNHENSYNDDRFVASMVLSPRNNNNNYLSNNKIIAVETAHFLRTCGLCERRLAPGRDIYMYRGDGAFCSLECREEQMKQDEIRDKSRAMASKKDEDTTSNKTASRKTETIVAA